LPRSAKTKPIPVADLALSESERSGAGQDPFRQVREAHRSETAEDYVELIAELIEENGEARMTDIAARMGVSAPTVAKTIGRLRRDGLVRSKPYRSIGLTEEGRELAARTKERHELVYAFLRAIGVDEATARRDSEGMEHHVSEETLAVFRKIIRQRAG
jgi:DtxR family manganese transport transcriptional regulator